MKFYINESTTIEFGPEHSDRILIVDSHTFTYKGKTYNTSAMQFQLEDIYFLINSLMINNPGKKVFVEKFEQASGNTYAMHFAVEE